MPPLITGAAGEAATAAQERTAGAVTSVTLVTRSILLCARRARFGYRPALLRAVATHQP